MRQAFPSTAELGWKARSTASKRMRAAHVIIVLQNWLKCLVCVKGLELRMKAKMRSVALQLKPMATVIMQNNCRTLRVR
jgi:hypothetical protein